MVLDIDRDNLKQGVLGLAVALVEIIRDALRVQALKRMEIGDLSGEECERLGRALRNLDAAIDSIKKDQGLENAVRAVREGLDDAVNKAVQTLLPSCQHLDEHVLRRGRKRMNFVSVG